METRGFTRSAADEPERVALVLPDGTSRSAGELLAFCRGRLAHDECPRSIDFVATLPRDPNGKLYERRLRDPHWAGRERQV